MGTTQLRVVLTALAQEAAQLPISAERDRVLAEAEQVRCMIARREQSARRWKNAS